MPRHSETRTLPYTARQMYDLVADIEAYPQFLPWTAAARIRSTTPASDGEVGGDGGGDGEVVLADLVISFKVFREKFGSRVTLHPSENRIETDYLDGPFKHLHSEWSFRDVDGGCEVAFWVEFEFRNALLGRVIGVVFNEAMSRVVVAFERRAKALYGVSA